MAIVLQVVPSAVLVLVGDGPHRQTILEESARLGLGDALRITGQVSHPEVRDWLGIADVAVIPFSNQYRSPVKLFEYMALGLPIAAARTPPIESVVTDGAEGVLFEPAPKRWPARSRLASGSIKRSSSAAPYARFQRAHLESSCARILAKLGSLPSLRASPPPPAPANQRPVEVMQS
jgi:glycosyltransferase involved in cell wall biosynthesis